MRPMLLPLLLATSLSVTPSWGQEGGYAERLPRSVLDVRAPYERIEGEPGNMRIVDRTCQAMPRSQLRRRIVDTAVQEWAWFGYSTDVQPRTPAVRSTPRRPFVYPRLPPEQSARVASSIAGYWAATPDSDWILQGQNSAWQDKGIGERWRNAWSAAFISWVMCESGLSEPEQFRRAIAHHSYIDQAIVARDTSDGRAAYRAYGIGDQAIQPGDLLCRGSRPAYRNLAERRSQLGVGARTHCDIVVKVDEAQEQISVIGGNVRATVRMKVIPATREEGQPLRPIADNGRTLFAHLQLQATEIEADALDHAPSLQDNTCLATIDSSKPTTDCQAATNAASQTHPGVTMSPRTL